MGRERSPGVLLEIKSGFQSLGYRFRALAKQRPELLPSPKKRARPIDGHGLSGLSNNKSCDN